MSIGFASNSSVKQAGRGATLGTATSSFVGVVRVDATTLNVDQNGTVSVNIGNSSQAGIVRPDGTSILVTSGVISVAVYPSATSSVFGIIRVDGTSLVTVAPGIAAIAVSSNGYGVRTVSSSAPSGGADGDVWYQV